MAFMKTYLPFFVWVFLSSAKAYSYYPQMAQHCFSPVEIAALYSRPESSQKSDLKSVQTELKKMDKTLSTLDDRREIQIEKLAEALSEKALGG